MIPLLCMASMQTLSNQLCWITAGVMPLRRATVLSINTTHAVVRLDENAPLPKELDLYFTFNCTVGRKCLVDSQRDNVVALTFLARLGASYAAHNDNIIQV